jgi:uncharacterized RDD family membrane protein YckC
MIRIWPMIPSAFSTREIVGLVGLPAVVFLVAYFPIVTKLSRGLVSPYAKADLGRRMGAATIDGVLVAILASLYATTGLVIYIAVAAAYLLLRDGVKGQSIGKFVCGLVVISLERGRPCSVFDSVRRNALLLLPGANLVAIFLEASTVVRDPQGQRLGDRLAQTQVVEGFGARELVKAFQRWLMGVGTEFGGAIGKRHRAPVRDRAA